MSKEHIGLRTWSVFVFVFLLAIEDIVEVVQSDSECVCGVRVRAISCFTEPGTEWYEMQVCKVDNIASVHWREEGCIGKYIPRDRQISLDVFPRLKAVYSHCLYMGLFILSTLCPFASLLQHYQHFPHENVCLIFAIGSVFPNARGYIS